MQQDINLTTLQSEKVKTEPAVSLFEQVGYAVGETGLNLIFQVVSTFYLFFLTEIAGITAAAAGTLLLVARFLDGFSDPASGYFLDNYRLPERFGRLKGWLLFGSPALALNTLFLFWIPDWSLTAKLVWVYSTYLLFGIVYDVVSTPYSALLSAMTQDPDVRNNASALRGIFSGGSIFLVNVAVIKIVDWFENPQTGWTIAIFLFSLLAIVLLAVTYFSTQERIEPVDNESSYTVNDGVKLIIQNKPLMILFGFTLLATIGRTIVNTSNLFYFKYVLNDETLLITSSFYSMTVIGAFAIAPKVAKVWGKKRTAVYGGALTALAMIGRLLLPSDAVTPIMITYAIMAFGTGFPWVMGWSMMTDVVDYTEYSSGVRAENIINAANTFVYKAAQGLGAAMPAYILAQSGYQAGQLVQGSSTSFGILLTVTVIPAALTVLGLIVLIYYPLSEKKHQEIVAELAKRKQSL